MLINKIKFMNRYLKETVRVLFLDYDPWPQVAVRVPPLVKELCGFGHTGSVVPDAGEQQQVAPQHSLRHWSRVSPFLPINQPPEQIHNVALRNTCGQCISQCRQGLSIRNTEHVSVSILKINSLKSKVHITINWHYLMVGCKSRTLTNPLERFFH